MEIESPISRYALKSTKHKHAGMGDNVVTQGMELRHWY